MRQDLVVFAIPNGGYRKAKEAARLKAEGVLAGVPDIHVAKPTAKYHGLYLEFKTSRGKTSEDQEKIIAKLREERYCVEIVRSVDEAWKTLTSYLAEEI